MPDLTIPCLQTLKWVWKGDERSGIHSITQFDIFLGMLEEAWETNCTSFDPKTFLCHLVWYYVSFINLSHSLYWRKNLFSFTSCNTMDVTVHQAGALPSLLSFVSVSKVCPFTLPRIHFHSLWRLLNLWPILLSICPERVKFFKYSFIIICPGN